MGGEVIGSAGAIVDKAYHVNVEGNGSVRGLEHCAKGECIVALEQSRTDKSPDRWSVASTLARPMDREEHAVGVCGFRDSKCSFQFIFGFLEGSGVNHHDRSMLAELPIDNGCDGDNDAVVAGGGILVEIADGFP